MRIHRLLRAGLSPISPSTAALPHSRWRKDMNTFDTAYRRPGLTVSEMISEAAYRLVLMVERALGR